MSRSFLEVGGCRNGMERAPGWNLCSLSSLLLLPEHWNKCWHWGLLPAWNDVSSPATLRPFLFFLPFQLLLNEQ